MADDPKELTTRPSVAMTTRGLAPRNFEEAYRFANLLAASDLVPKDYREKPGNCMVAIQMGMELGLAPMQALQSIAVINGRPSLWGDAGLALIQSHPDFVNIEETWEGAGETLTAVCTITRRGRTPVTRRFGVEDAKQASLWGKSGPWQQYKKRMLQMRARWWSTRDIFADVLKGIHAAEEAQDMPPETVAGATAVALAETLERRQIAQDPKPTDPPSQPSPPQQAQLGAQDGTLEDLSPVDDEGRTQTGREVELALSGAEDLKEFKAASGAWDAAERAGALTDADRVAIGSAHAARANQLTGGAA